MRKLVAGIVTCLALVALTAAAFAVDGDTTEPTTDPALTTTSSSTTTSTTSSTTTTTVAPPQLGTDEVVVKPTEPAEGEGEAVRSTEGCDGGTYKNHGDYVSSVAHNPDRQPGDVAAAAQSDCGKPLAATGESSTADPTSPGNGNGKGKSKP